MELRRAMWISLALATAGCTAIAGLDGDYRVGEPGAGGSGSGGSSTTQGVGAGPGAGGATGGAGSGGTTTVASGGSGGSVVDPMCGNGIIENGEQCDDGQGSPSPYCDGCVVVCNGPYEVEDPQTHHCYYDTVSDGMHNTWQAGRDWCINVFQGDLVVISNAAELTFVQGLAPNIYDEDRWIGARDPNEGMYEWVNGEPWTYQDGMAPWAANEPNGSGGDDCVALQSNGTLDEVACDQGFTHQLCEREPVGN